MKAFAAVCAKRLNGRNDCCTWAAWPNKESRQQLACSVAAHPLGPLRHARRILLCLWLGRQRVSVNFIYILRLAKCPQQGEGLREGWMQQRGATCGGGGGGGGGGGPVRHLRGAGFIQNNSPYGWPSPPAVSGARRQAWRPVGLRRRVSCGQDESAMHSCCKERVAPQARFRVQPSTACRDAEGARRLCLQRHSQVYLASHFLPSPRSPHTSFTAVSVRSRTGGRWRVTGQSEEKEWAAGKSHRGSDACWLLPLPTKTASLQLGARVHAVAL